MTVSLYDFTVPAFKRALKNLARQLDKAQAHATQKKVDFSAFAQSRLIADMHPLTSQVQIACDNAKGAVARLAGIEAPRHEDIEKTYEELKARIAKTLDFIDSVKPEQFSGAESREVILKFPNLTLTFNGHDYVTKFALPNFYFHATMAYALMRKNGVELGKADYMGNVQ